MTPRPKKAPWALGVWLAARGPTAVASFAIAALETLAGVVAAFAVAHRGGIGAARVATLTAQAVAWSAGVTLAFGAALRASHRDREEGVLALVRARGASLGAYVRGRVGGLVVLLALVVGAATVVVALAAVSASATPKKAWVAGAAALVYALAFAATLGPVTMATVGARSRVGGYVTLLVVLAAPEAASPWTSKFLPSGWEELTSIPAALEAMRVAVVSPMNTAAHGARAAAALVVVIAASMWVIGVRMARVEAEPAS
ncbi:MAG TPA: hypothetical protein VGM06_07085 [Polyangiaceae bacterium]|jgi:hypothetical protein